LLLPTETGDGTTAEAVALGEDTAIAALPTGITPAVTRTLTVTPRPTQVFVTGAVATATGEQVADVPAVVTFTPAPTTEVFETATPSRVEATSRPGQPDATRQPSEDLREEATPETAAGVPGLFTETVTVSPDDGTPEATLEPRVAPL